MPTLPYSGRTGRETGYAHDLRGITSGNVRTDANQGKKMKKTTALFGALAVLAGIMCCPANAQVPANFPGITVSNYNPSGVADGKIFLAVGSDTPDIGYYLMILENDGSVVDGSKYKELLEDYSYDFKVQANGLLSYAQFIHHHPYTGGGDARHKIVDSDLNAVETVP